jgi:hypothetical protein
MFPDYQNQINKYVDEVQRSLEMCKERHWRCEAKSKNGTIRCSNRWDGHNKGHQFRARTPNSLKSGKTSLTVDPLPISAYIEDAISIPTLLIGGFKCAVNSQKVLLALHSEIRKILQTSQNTSNRKLAFSQHARAIGVTSIVSNRTCLVCLSNCPVYILPCKNLQHTICESCVERFSSNSPRSSSILSVESCPLGCQFTTSPWLIRRKPLSAGVRVLTLDGYVKLKYGYISVADLLVAA